MTDSAPTKDTLVVLSGGMDSTTLLYDYRQRVALAVTFDYGSNHNAREAECARLSCERTEGGRRGFCGVTGTA